MKVTATGILITLLTITVQAAHCAERVSSAKFPICPDSPNCVNSLQHEKRHAIAPISFQGSQKEAIRKAASALQLMGGEVTIQENVIHAVFTSAIFGFKDDVHVMPDQKVQVLHVRSASRTGYYDFGVNRKRIEELRELILLSN
ncbi:DUF1499 domain-containing protein [Oleidesulfovibrio sp.]|uniref:DUF1499 domain-containing protein n=1 Tax=Oleidesulfovibrio sp. TaxID=2909707 RepID=UPI003A893208